MIETVDKSGMPRDNSEIEETIKQLEKELIKGISPIMVHYPTIIDGLKELLDRRKRDGGTTREIPE